MTTIHNLTIDEIPDLPGYMTVSAVCDQFGQHKNTIYRMVFEQGLFPGAYKVMYGQPNRPRDPSKSFDDRKFILLLPAHEVQKVMRQRQQRAAAPPPLGEQLNAWHRRVRQWGRAEGWNFAPIKKVGRLHTKLISDYLKANPQDPCPSAASEANKIAAG